MALVDRRVRWLALSFARAARAALFLASCPLCGAREVGDGLGCEAHRLTLEVGGGRCRRCFDRLPRAIADGELCARCRASAAAFARAIALLDYADPSARAWLLALKHGGRRDLAAHLGTPLGARLLLEEPSGLERVLVPVPLHPARRLERGYDQAAILARAASEEARVPVVVALARARATPPQGSLGSSARDVNVRDAFREARVTWGAARAIAGKEVWLVDDVLTSGATASECARVSKRLGASRVCVLALARA